MEPTGDQIQPDFTELSDQDRVQILDQIVLPEFRKKNRSPLFLETAYNYRNYIIRPMEQQAAQVVDILDKLYSLFKGPYINTALLNIKDHPGVLTSDRKIHLQPQSQDLLKVVEILAKSVADEDDLYQSFDQFKVTTNPASLKTATSQPLIVVYLMGSANIDQMIAEFVSRFADFAPAGRAPRYNQQHGPIVFSAVGDGYLKGYLSRFELLDRFYDPATNFSRPKEHPEHITPTTIDLVKRPVNEAIASLFFKQKE